MVSSNGSIQLLRSPRGLGRALQHGPGADKESSILAYLLEEGESHVLKPKTQQLTTWNRLWYAPSPSDVSSNWNGENRQEHVTNLMDNRGHLLHGRCWYVYFPISLVYKKDAARCIG